MLSKSDDSGAPDPIIVVGGGFAGVGALKVLLASRSFLRRRGLRVVLVTPEPAHTLHFALYEVATAELPRRSVAVPYRSIFSHGLGIIRSEVVRVDPEKRLLELGRHAPPERYSRLVLAPGSVTHYAGIPGMARSSTVLRKPEDALQIKRRLKELAETGGSVIVAGGGFSGTELAAEVAYWRKSRGAEEKLRLSLIERSPRLLPELDPLDSEIAAHRLSEVGVQLFLDTTIMQALADEVLLEDGSRLHTDLLIWTGGIEPSPLARESGLAIDEAGRLKVDRFLRVPGHTDIFAAGDAVALKDASGSPLPAVAAVAEVSGQAAAVNLLRDLRGQRLRPVRIRHRGYIVPLGGRHAAAHLGQIHLRGRLAWALRQAVILSYLTRILPLRQAFKRWRRFESIDIP